MRTTFPKSISQIMIAAFALLAAVLALPAITASAADGAYSTGALLPEYSSSEEVSVLDYKADAKGSKDSASAIQKALNVGKSKGSDSHQVVVRVPAGTYKISKTLKIYSNTHLILEDGATIVKGFSQGCMLKNTMQYGGGGYGADRNIVIEGGTWDGNTSAYNSMYTFSNIRIAHANNIAFRGVSVINNKNGHHLEIGGVQGLSIDGCYFSGYTGSLVKEAIQLDVMNSAELFAGFAPFDDTACDNVLIQNCSFRNIPRAIGSHSAVVGKYYTNVTIRNNNFSDIWDVCMILYNYRKCTVSGNTITDCGAGLTFNYMSDESFRHYFCAVTGNSTSGINTDADTVITGNSITTVQTTMQFEPYAIKLFGKSVSANKDYPAYNYTVDNVSITGNTIVTAGSAINATNVYDSEISDNEISPNADVDCVDSDLISLSYCYSTDIKSNKISGSYKSGLRASNASDLSITGNTFSKNAVCAMVLGNTKKSSVNKNTIKDSATGGVKLGEGCASVTVNKNVIKNCSEYGIQVVSAGSGKDIKLKSNDLSGGAIGISCIKSGKAYLYGNSFEAVSDKVYADAEGLITLAEAKNFTAEEVTENRIKLIWNSISEADGISVYRKQAGAEEFELIASVDSGALYQDERLNPGTNYVYKIVPFITVNDTGVNNTESKEIGARTKINISTAYIECADTAAFTAMPVTPNFKIIADSRELMAGADYDYKFENNIYTGTATLTATGKGDYVGSLTYSFEITLGMTGTSGGVSRNAIAASAFTNGSGYRFKVSCTEGGGALLAQGDKRLTREEIAINSIRLEVPVDTSVRAELWNGSGYRGF